MSAPSDTHTPSKILALEGVRGIAAMIVVFSHLRNMFLVDSDTQLLNVLSAWPDAMAKATVLVVEGLLDGAFSVWTFWVLSGFVLSHKYFKHIQREQLQAARIVLVDAAIRRYPRLLIPVLLSVLFEVFMRQHKA